VSLVAAKLASGLLKLSQTPPKNYVEAGRLWSEAYAQYAVTAQSPTAAPPAPLEPNRQVLAAALAATFVASRNPVQTANQIASALTVFWLAPPVVFGPGVVTAVGGTQALASVLPGAWVSNTIPRMSAEAAAQKIAAVIDLFTHTVIVTSPGPIVGPIV